MKKVNTMQHKSSKQGGFVMTSELVLIATILVIGMTAGLTTLRDAVTGEMEDVAEAIGALDQSYAFNGLVNAQQTAAVDGSSFGDAVDTNAGDGAEFDYAPLDNVEGSSITAGAASSSAAGTGDVPIIP